MTSRDRNPLTTDPRSAIEAMLRPDLRGGTAYGAPQLDVAVALNTNENSYPVPPVVVAAMTAAVAEAAAGLNRYPDREFTALREALAAYLSRSGTVVTAEQVWAGNGSNEVLLHRIAHRGTSSPKRAVTASPWAGRSSASASVTTWRATCRRAPSS